MPEPRQAASPAPPQRLRLDLSGAVQGVGFRPFVHRLAVGEGLGGFVRNTGEGVSLEIEGAGPAVARFLARLDAEMMPPAAIHRRRTSALPSSGDTQFHIVASSVDGQCPAHVMPDLAACEACVAEVMDPQERRYRYPFTTCVRCGPRYSILEALPYDRDRTVMRQFPMCRRCLGEYEDPASRRFHAETNACPDCGPQLALRNAAGAVLAQRHAALAMAVAALRDGQVVALKGLGGFQLLADARNEAAVQRLRARKRRPAKPFALMAADLAAAQALAQVGAAEAASLCSAAAPVVLLRARAGAATIAPGVAPGNPLLGIMLPCTPLHHLLLRECGFPLVATSGNRSGEPIAAGWPDAAARLGSVADLFLDHDRPILHPVDDSVVRLIAGRIAVLRSARGFAPLALEHAPADAPVLALGGQGKNAVALGFAGRVVLGPHIGDLDGVDTRAAFARAVGNTAALYRQPAPALACDEHPGYYSTHYAHQLGRPVRRVPHHLAHVLAGMVDNRIDGAVLGIAWDGTGYGADGLILGSECLAVSGAVFRRVARLLPFRLPGGEQAVREPRRAAAGALHAVFGDAALDMSDLAPIAAFSAAERRVLGTMLRRGVNAPWCSSSGRLFDAVAAILGLCQRASFEGEAAMAVEFAAGRAEDSAAAERLQLPVPDLLPGPVALVDWRPWLDSLVTAVRQGAPAEPLAAAFQDALAQLIVAVAQRAGIARVLLTGGCFQNARLAEQAIARLRAAGFTPAWHRQVPPNDGGLAVGQAAYHAQPLREECS
ncbi:MAG: carbamoyltransferase HypF [Nevskia sp.]|nr:carbamoyltransferase HypF [Nevskia sp.]